jgi:hypothetical protein
MNLSLKEIIAEINKPEIKEVDEKEEIKSEIKEKSKPAIKEKFKSKYKLDANGNGKLRKKQDSIWYLV